MKLIIESNTKFIIETLSFKSGGELHVVLRCGDGETACRYRHASDLGAGAAEERPRVSLLDYSRSHALRSDIKPKTRDSYRHMTAKLEEYGDRPLDEVTTEYLQGYISHLQSAGLKPNTVRLYFQKLACVLHDAYKHGLFDERILARVRRPRKEQERRTYLTETDLKRMASCPLPERDADVGEMFLFSCLTGLRFSDVSSLRWRDVKREGRHLCIKFRQRKTGTDETLPLCDGAETLLRRRDRSGGLVFPPESNQRANTVLKRWCKAAKVRKPVTFHTGRHTFCVLLLTREVPIYTVQRLMCHSDLGTTKVYADITCQEKSKAVKRLPTLGEGIPCRASA